jgi:hypothetical protein
MTKIVRESIINEGYGSTFTGGAGYSFTGGLGGTSRSGSFSGASNLGGPSCMYTYEIKALNHTLEQRPTVTLDQIEQIRIGSRVSGEPIRSNASPISKKVIGMVQKIVISDNGALKYYIVLDQDTATPVKLEPTSVKLVQYEPVRRMFDAPDLIPTSRAGRKARVVIK